MCLCFQQVQEKKDNDLLHNNPDPLFQKLNFISEDFPVFYLFLFVYPGLFVAKGGLEVGLRFWKYFLQMNFYIKREMSGKSLSLMTIRVSMQCFW